MPLRIVFCGTPAFALPSLRHLASQEDFQLESVVTQPGRPRGRGGDMSDSPVKEFALEAGIPVYQPEKMKSESAENFFRRVAPDAAVIIAYGQIIPANLLEIPRLGWINLHASLLPKYRGAAPMQWAIVNGEKRTGVVTMRIDAGLDTGPVLLRHEAEIAPDETAPELSVRLAEAGAPLVAETLRGLDRGTLQPEAQDNAQASFAPPLKKEDGRIDWTQSFENIYNRMRGLQPWPGTFTTFRGQTCAIWGKPAEAAAASNAEPGTIFAKGGEIIVACGGQTALRIEFLRLAGRKRVTSREFASGAHLSDGEKFV
ncbi:MAG: methionyl-tRNA formyltransferase [Candidatus Acidiferrales bacterium]